ncbi:MAG: pantetheine-phosphate adenylyltransferase [Bacteroidaceae bacterium]|nr:pantetheine-phosphate adenylyltransferase [Bacteroidaceae bacterium]
MTALFPGSFDPFTTGHDDIVRRFLPLFDRIVVAVGVNERKQTMLTAEERVRQIKELYSNEPKIDVQTYSDLTVDMAQRVGARYIIKGVRSVKDFEYEREQAEINRRLCPEIDTIILFASPDKAIVSSSVVRELQHFGKDTKQFLP